MKLEKIGRRNMFQVHLFLLRVVLLILLLPQIIRPGFTVRRPFKHISYLSYREINTLVKGYAKRYKHVKTKSIGRTWEGKSIQVVIIGKKGKILPKIMIDAGIHAREWASPAATLYVIEKLAKSFKASRRRKTRKKHKKQKRSRSRRLKSEVENFEWHIIPLLNPDGYQYSRTTDRLWRKNRRPNKGFPKCPGVDLNRNFDKGYGIESSTDPCEEIYKGTSPFSEKESKALRKYVNRLGKFTAGISVHSWGSVFLYPWGFTATEDHERHKDLANVGKAMVEALKKRNTSWSWVELDQENHVQEYDATGHLGNFSTMSGGEFSVAGGATDDWYISKGAQYSFTIELPGVDRNGKFWEFSLPPSDITWVGEQLWVSLSTLAKEMEVL